MVPDQVAMGPGRRTLDEGHNRALDDPVLLSGSARSSRVATVGYVLIVAGHVRLLTVHASMASAEGRLFSSLAAVEVALAFEALIFAIGGWGRSCGLSLLTLAGRVRLLGAAMAWPWLLPWAAELSCRCGTISTTTGVFLLHQGVAAALLISGFYLLREVSFLARGEPPSALNAGVQPQIGDCLPSQAVFGGQFRLDKADLEETGRAVFVPARPRQGLYIGSGLGMLGHLIAGFNFAGNTALPPWLLMGAVGALFARWFGQMPKFKGREKGAPTDSLLLWRREGPRLVCRLGELFWLWCCLAELQRCETASTWLSACQ